MESSRNSSSSELPERVAAALSPAVPPGAHLALGLSGGIDSVALLSILLGLAPALRFSLRAVHVNHGISPNAGRWAEFCSELCGKSRVPLQLETVDLSPYRSLGLEGAARQARHEVFARLEADFVVLAQHRDDQAETLLLRLLRGRGNPVSASAGRGSCQESPAPLVRSAGYPSSRCGADQRAHAPAARVPGRRPRRPVGARLGFSSSPGQAVPRACRRKCRTGFPRELERRKSAAAARARRSAEVQTGRRAGAEPGEAASGAGHRARAAGRRAIAAGFAQAAAHAEESVSGARHSA